MERKNDPMDTFDDEPMDTSEIETPVTGANPVGSESEKKKEVPIKKTYEETEKTENDEIAAEIIEPIAQENEIGHHADSFDGNLEYSGSDESMQLNVTEKNNDLGVEATHGHYNIGDFMLQIIINNVLAK